MTSEHAPPAETDALIDGPAGAADTQPQDTALAEPALGEREPDLGYQVTLSAFSGPLDLLLHLVRKAELDIADISIVAIADQFIAAVENWEDTDLETTGHFILMAATLLEINARSIAPLRDDDEAEEEDEWVDPGADLVRQLLAFRKTKDAVHWLQELEDQRLRWHRRRFQESIPEDPAEAEAIDLENADPYLLYQTWEKLLHSIAGHRPRTVVYDDIPIEERVRKIEQVLSTAQEAQLHWLLAQETKQISRVGVVVASLEGLRKRVMEAAQHEQYGPVYLHYLPPDRRQWTPLIIDQDAEADPLAKKKRRRRPPLFTWRPPEGGEAEVEDGDGDAEQPEEVVVESDEQRFIRELNEQCAVDTILDRVRHLDQHLQAHLQQQGLSEDEQTVADLPPAAAVSEQSSAPPQAAEPTCPVGADATALDIDEDDDEDEEEFDDDDDDFDDDDDDDDDEAGQSERS